MCNSGKKTLEVKIHCLSPGQNSWLREQSLQSASALDAKILATDLAWAGAHCTFGSHRESSGSQQTSPGWSLQPRGVQSPWQACKDRTKRANAPGITSVHPNIKAIQTRRKVRWLRNYPWRVKSCRSQRQTIFILMMQGILAQNSHLGGLWYRTQRMGFVYSLPLTLSTQGYFPPVSNHSFPRLTKKKEIGWGTQLYGLISHLKAWGELAAPESKGCELPTLPRFCYC